MQQTTGKPSGIGRLKLLSGGARKKNYLNLNLLTDRRETLDANLLRLGPAQNYDEGRVEAARTARRSAAHLAFMLDLQNKYKKKKNYLNKE